MFNVFIICVIVGIGLAIGLFVFDIILVMFAGGLSVLGSCSTSSNTNRTSNTDNNQNDLANESQEAGKVFYQMILDKHKNDF